MEPLDAYRKLARGTTRDRFAARFPHLFLLKRPVAVLEKSGDEDDVWGEKISFQTRVLAPDQEPDLIDEAGPIAKEWRVVEVKKRDGNPFPDRISVGRAKNCDIVLRFPSVSKLHAHFLRRTGERTMRLADQQSSNRTFVNGKQLAPGQIVPLRTGDKIRFGALQLELFDAAGFYALLAATA